MGLLNLFRKQKGNPESSAPRTDTERWLTAACAIWSDYCGGRWNYIGGFEKTSANISRLKEILKSDWLVANHDSGIDLVNYLLSHTGADTEKFAFDYACAINICGRMYLCDYLSREEYVHYSTQAGQKLQQRYHSWEEYCTGYIEGTRLEPGVAADTQEFMDSYQKLAALSDGPYQINWNLKL